MVRDGVCRFPGCHRTTHLQAHHIKSWAAGGATDLDNLVLLCRLHHVAVHEAGFSIVRADSPRRPNLPDWQFLDPKNTPITSATLDASNPDPSFPTAFPLDRDLDYVTKWTQPDAENIRPRWAGERFCLADMVGALFSITVPTKAA